VYIKHERSEIRPISQLSLKIKSEFNIFKKGSTEWYQYKWPPKLSFEEPRGLLSLGGNLYMHSKQKYIKKKVPNKEIKEVS